MPKENRKLEKAINLLQKNIDNINNELIRVEEKNNKTIINYSLKENKKFIFTKKNQSYLGELGRAYFLSTLLNKGLKNENIILEQNTEIGSGNKKKRADLFLKTKEILNNRECYILTEIKTSINKIKKSKLDRFFKNQLYNIATSLRENPTYSYYPCFLMLVTIEIDTENETINVKNYLTSLDKIRPQNIDVSFYKEEFFIKDGELYINTSPLTYKDLKDFESADEFRGLLNQELHQKLRTYGFVGEDAFEIIFQLLLAKLYEEMEILNNSEFDKTLSFQVLPEDYLNKDKFRKRINDLYQNARIFFFKEDAKIVKKDFSISKELSNEALLELVKIMEFYRFKNTKKIKDDVLGDVFEEFIHQTYKQSKGMFFTHPNITSFCAKCLGFNKREIQQRVKEENLYICDTSCGSGSFLIEALRELYKEDNFKDIKKEAEKNFYGIDVSARAVEITKVNMALNGDGSAKIYKENALEKLDNLKYIFKFLQKEKKGEIDYILSNPPFSLEGLNKKDLSHFTISDYLPDDNQSEFYFIERWWELLTEGGMIGVVLPLSVIENTSNKKALKIVNCFFDFKAIIYLPEFAFSPFANQKTLLLFARKRAFEETKELFELMEKNENEFLKRIDKEIFFKEVKSIGYKRIKKDQIIKTIHLKENELDEKLANEIFENLYKDNLSNENKENLLKILKIFSSKESEFSVLKHFAITNTFSYADTNQNSHLIVETGDIHKRTTLILPKNIDDLSDSKKINLNNKIKNGRLVKLLPNDIIISPVRTYQKKFAIVTPNASKYFLFSKDFIVLRNKKVINTPFGMLEDYSIMRENGIDYLKLYYKKDDGKLETKSVELIEFFLAFVKESLKVINSFYNEYNEKILFFSSITGKSGYPKLSKTLLSNNYDLLFTNDKIVTMDMLIQYDNVYDSFYKIIKP